MPEPLPPIADKLPPDEKQAEAEFDRRVKAAFPIGMPESKVISQLTTAGFEVDRLGTSRYRVAELKRKDLICQMFWSVGWKAEQGALGERFGEYGSRCL